MLFSRQSGMVNEREVGMTRVAALQFASGTDVAANLETCLRMIDQATLQSADVMVLPEFSNHISWYDDAAHAHRVSVDLEGEFLSAIAERAARYSCHIVINVSLRQTGGELTISSIMYGPQGQRLAVADKQTLMGHENIWFRRASELSDVVTTEHGNIAMFPCRDGVTCETPRGLALRGAQLFCDSLNSFALDEASLHVPARAPENRVFLVAANKVGPLIPEHLLEAVSAETHIPMHFLNGAGESQVVSPRGEILARGPKEGEAVVWADVDLGQAEDKSRPDGTDIFLARRPELYAEIVKEPAAEQLCATAVDEMKVALLSPAASGESALDEIATLVAGLDDEVQLALLPELFCYSPGLPDPLLAALAVEVLQTACSEKSSLMLCTSLALPADDGLVLTAVLLGAQGLIAQQPVLHKAARYAWSGLGQESSHCEERSDAATSGTPRASGDRRAALAMTVGGGRSGCALATVDLPFGRVAMLAGDDAIHPEMAKIAALAGAQILLAPICIQEDWEVDFGLRSRAAENRVCVLASSRPHNGRAGLVASLERDFTLMSTWQYREFDGRINDPVITLQQPGQSTLVATIHPVAANNKLMSEQTDLLLDRPWLLSGTLVE
jgi:predicted amidohydrolase